MKDERVKHKGQEKVDSIKRMINEIIVDYDATIDEAYEVILLDYENDLDDTARNLTRLDIAEILDASFQHKIKKEDENE